MNWTFYFVSALVLVLLIALVGSVYMAHLSACRMYTNSVDRSHSAKDGMYRFCKWELREGK